MLGRIRARHPWADHLIRTIDRYMEHNAYQYAAAITYFSVLSVIPILMVGLSIGGFVLADDQPLIREVRSTILDALPAGLDQFAAEVFDNVLEQRASLGVFGLLIGLYAGWNWVNALRDALTAMWELEKPDLPILRTILMDLVALFSLAAALVVSFTMTALGGALNSSVLRWLGLDHTSWAGTWLTVLSVPLAVVADWLVFLWVLAKLPRIPVNTRNAARGALATAIGFEVLKQAANFYLGLLGRSPTGAAFGSVIGLLVFIYLVARLLLFVAAWIATPSSPPQAPSTSGFTLGTTTHAPLRPATVGWLLAIGAAAMLMLQRTFRRRRGRVDR